MERWDAGVCEDHRALAAQAGALEAALTLDVGEEDRRVVFSWVVRTLWPSLGLHLRKEEEALFPPLEKLLGAGAVVLRMLKGQNQELRASHRRLAELGEGSQPLDWDRIKLASYSFIEFLEDHEKKVDRLLLDVLEFSLKPKELKALAEAFEKVAQKAHEEEGWPLRGGGRKDRKLTSVER